MFFYLNKNTIIQLIASAGLLIWAIISIITQMQIMPPDHQAFLYKAVYPFLANNVWSYKTLAIILLIFSTLMVQRFFSISSFAENTTYMPMVFFLLLLNLNHSFTIFTPVFITIATTAFLIMMNSENEHGYSISNRMFSSGLIIGITTLFDYNAVWLMLLMIIVLITTRISKLKEILILLIGFLFIYIYLFTYGFVTDKTTEIFAVFNDFQFFTIIHHVTAWNWLNWLMIAVLAGTILIFIFACKIYFDNKVVALRKRFVTHIFLIISCIIIGIFSPYETPQALPYVLLPTSILFALTSLIERRKWLHDIFIIGTCILLWL
ncbi:MAG: hypothetical protein K6A41_07745 [Bacteroidales bacterium]|nr:hypothetical protein [Bacteroidales bacterium]